MKVLSFISGIFLFANFSLFCADGRVLLQGFHWNSVRSSKPWWNIIYENSSEIKRGQFDLVWLPPSNDSLSDEGYLPRKLYIQDSKYGTEDALKSAISKLHSYGIKVVADIVINHRVGVTDWADFRDPDWKLDACVKDDEYKKCEGNYDTGKGYDAARDIDHTQKYVRDSIKQWMLWLKNSIGYDGWRYDYARGFSSQYILEYTEATNPSFSVAEIWDDLDLNNTDKHRQALCNWMDSVKGKIKVFDFTTKGILQYVIQTGEYWRLVDKNGRPSGLLGWWPDNAVTFIENHDTQNRTSGSGHRSWPFPSNRILEGYAYILTHPGIPTVFWPHFFDYGFKEEIIKMISIRKKYGINSASSVYIIAATNGLYVARIDDKLIVKMGSSDYSPDSSYKLLTSGYNYAIWGR
ncbi:MAG: alpha-amylase [Elusimicrobiota bacterium]